MVRAQLRGETPLIAPQQFHNKVKSGKIYKRRSDKALIEEIPQGWSSKFKLSHSKLNKEVSMKHQVKASEQGNK